MEYNDQVKRFNYAKDYANEKHEGQLRLGGERFFIHPLRVCQRVKTILQQTIAILHDTVEDTDATLEEIEKKFGKEVADGVDAMTHRVGESYHDYITRVLTNPDAVAVKIADICDNLNDDPSQNAIKKGLGGLARLLKFDGELIINYEKKEN